MKGHRNLSVFVTPSLPLKDDIVPSLLGCCLIARELPHLLLGSEFVVTFVYAMLQRQYLLGLNDPKLLESLIYLIQTMSSCHGPATDAALSYGECGRAWSWTDVKRIEVALDSAPWAVPGASAQQTLCGVDCRELLWRNLQHTEVILEEEVNFRCPQNIVGVRSRAPREP